MLTLLSEAHFWTYRNEINIKDNDFGAYRYNTKSSGAGKTGNHSIYRDGKSSYATRRGLNWNLDNKGPVKLKKCIKQLEDALKEFKIVFSQWKDNCILQLMLSNGLLIHICVNVFTGDILKIAFDKYFVGKLISETVVNVVITRMHIIISYNENQITFVYLQKPNMKRNAPEKINRMDPKIFNIIIGGPHGRKLGRFLSCNNSFDLLVIWTKSSQNEVYPWRPTVRDQDRANIHVYKFSRTKLELLSYHWTEYDPICVEFSKLNHNQFKSVEQKISKKGDVTIENCTYEINNSVIQRISVTSIPLQTQVCCHALSPDYEKLMLGCIDGSVLLFDESRGITHHVKAAFIPTLISWHCDSAIVMISNERCQFQCFDISLSCVKNQLISEDMTPSNVLDLSGYFSYQPALNKICWSKKPELALNNEKYVQSDSFLLLIFENGPISCLRFFGGSGLKGDIHTSGFTADVLVSKYLLLNHVEKAINILLCLNWDTYGAMCLISLHKIASYIFKQQFTSDREIQLQKALGSFHIPVKPLCYETEVEFGDQVRDITRKFFFYLLRFKSYEKAFSLAIDINDVDLFMDLYNSSRADNLVDISIDSFKKAEEIYNRSSSASDHLTCSHSSCSICTGSLHSESDAEPEAKEELPYNLNAIADDDSQISHPPLPKFSAPATISNPYIPPLPYFTNSLNVPSEIKINIPKPELRIATIPISSSNKLRIKSNSSLSIWTPNQSSSNRNIYSNSGNSSLLPQSTANANGLTNSPYVPKPLTAATSQASKRNLIKINNKQLISASHSNSTTARHRLGSPLQNYQLQSPHVVLDIIPKPKLNRQVQSTTVSKNRDREWMNMNPPPDQTIGIPLLASASPAAPLTTNHKPLSSSYSTNAMSMFHSLTASSLPHGMSSTTLSRLSSNNLYGHHHSPSKYASPTPPVYGNGNNHIPAYHNTYNLMNNNNIYNSNNNNNNLIPISISPPPPPPPPPPVIHEYPLISGKIPQIQQPASKSYHSTEYINKLNANYETHHHGREHHPHQQSVPPSTGNYSSGSSRQQQVYRTSSLTTAAPTGTIGTSSILSNSGNSGTNNSSNAGGTKKENGEKNKVKFSDTITVAVVPEIPRKERLKRVNGMHGMMTDPKKELADSLPLCHPNDEYLKDFTPMGAETNPNDDAEDSRNNSSIKVIHFGVV